MTEEEKQIFKNLIDKWQDNRDYLLLFDSTETLYEASGIYGCISDLKNAIAGLGSDLPLGGGEDYTSSRGMDSNAENTASSDYWQRLVSSLWAHRFLEVCPTAYVEALRRAGEPVEIYETDETGEVQWAITLNDGFWMDAFSTKEEAERLVEEMGWPIIGANVTLWRERSELPEVICLNLKS